MAYFQNAAENLGVDFYNTRPTESITKSMIGHTFIPDVEYAHMKHFYFGRLPMLDVDLRCLEEKGIEEFFDDKMKSKLDDLAKDFYEVSKQYPDSDYVFSTFPEALPFFSSCERDDETNFTARMIYGQNMLTKKGSILFEFYCLFMQRWRKAECDSLYGEKFQTVESMTPEEREKFDKQPEEKNEI